MKPHIFAVGSETGGFCIWTFSLFHKTLLLSTTLSSSICLQNFYSQLDASTCLCSPKGIDYLRL